jgi:hypothetical protein
MPRLGSNKVDASWVNGDVLELAELNHYIDFNLFDNIFRAHIAQLDV